MKYRNLLLTMVWGWVVLALGTHVAIAQLTVIPTDASGFTQFVADQLQKNLQDQKIEAASALTLRINQADGKNILQANLDRVFEFCSRNRERCSAAVNQYVSGVASVAQDRIRPIEKSMVRLALRPRQALEMAQKQLPPDAPSIVMRPFLSNLVGVAVLDFPRAIRPMNTADLTTLTLSADEAFALGTANLHTFFKPLREFEQPVAERSLRYLNDNAYEASRLLLHQDWADVAKVLGGELIAAAPAFDLLIYGRGGNAVAIDALRTIARDLARKAERPLSMSVFRWTESGWEEVK
jgi:uncharacterized protein YtpQ (UPF0354 family)